MGEQERDLDKWADEQLRASGYRRPVIPDWIKYTLMVIVPLVIVSALLKLIGIAADR